MTRIFKFTLLVILCCVLYAGDGLAESQTAVEAKKTEVVIIGTIHGGHYKNPKYTPEILKEIILSLKPDAILNELPLSLVDPNGRPLLRDPNKHPEGWASYQVATQLGIKQIPFDRPDRQEHYKKTKKFERRKKAEDLFSKWSNWICKNNPESVDLKIAQLSAYGDQAEIFLFSNAEPELINSDGFDAIVRIRHILWKEIRPEILRKYPGYETLVEDYQFDYQEWQERNRIMASNILKAAKDYPGKRLVVLTGAEHRYILRDLLKNEKSIELKEYWEIMEVDNYNAAESDQSDIKPKQETIKEIVTSVAGSGGPTRNRAIKLVKWMNENFEWTPTDYKRRTVEEIIQKRGGNCAEQARVLMALLKSAGIEARWVEEINIQPKSERRQADAKKLIAEHGSKLSVFGYMHNDHRWLEVYDDASDIWIPSDPTLGVFGVKEWVRVRLGFGERPEAAKDMIVPFVVIIRQKGQLVEDRSEHYLINEFNAYYGNELGKLSAWPQWVSAVRELSKLGSAAFAGEINLHEHVNLMTQLEQAYIALEEEYPILALNKK